ncbi:hypothetical protein ABMA77_13225 [Halobacteriovorax sp. RZ-1]|uniref:hypothetical protein n=1 Tax=unclassified Halobacteriovorax TaxID=2639665 RepID=UPI00371E5AAB
MKTIFTSILLVASVSTFANEGLNDLIGKYEVVSGSNCNIASFEFSGPSEADEWTYNPYLKSVYLTSFDENEEELNSTTFNFINDGEKKVKERGVFGGCSYRYKTTFKNNKLEYKETECGNMLGLGKSLIEKVTVEMDVDTVKLTYKNNKKASFTCTAKKL